jgi:hypothetical protein
MRILQKQLLKEANQGLQEPRKAQKERQRLTEPDSQGRKNVLNCIDDPVAARGQAPLVVGHEAG